MFGLSITHLLILLIIVLAIFGTKRLTSGLSGGAKDLGSAVKEFKKALRDDDAESKPTEAKITDPIHEAVDPAKLPPPDDKTPRG